MNEKLSFRDLLKMAAILAVCFLVLAPVAFAWGWFERPRSKPDFRR